MIRSEYPAVWAWIRLFEDLSGVDEDAFCDNNRVLSNLLNFAAEVYLPFLRSNSKAVEDGQSTTQVTLWNNSQTPITHEQPSFKYQNKCYNRIKEKFNQLGKDDQTDIVKYLKNV